MRISLLFVLLVAGSTQARAQVALYNAGFVADPPVPQAPTQQGWTLHKLQSHGLNPIADDGGLNAWEIVDSTPAGDYSYAYYQLDPAFLDYQFLGQAWELTATMKIAAGPDPALFIEVSSGLFFLDSGYRISFQVQGSDVLATNVFGDTFVCSNGADGNYHRFSLLKTSEVLYDSTEFLFDGQALGIVPEHFPGSQDVADGVKFGTLADVGIGRARFHRVEFRLLDDLGDLECSPAVVNSTGAPATLVAWGSPYTDQNLLELRAASMPTQQFGYLLASLDTGFVAMPGGSQGNLCLGGSIARFVTQIQSSGPSGSFVVPVDLTTIPVTPSVAVLPGDTWHFQGWYRDVNPVGTSNFTNSIGIAFR